MLGQSSTESGKLTMGFEPAEVCLRLQHAGRRPSQSHRGIPPAHHVPYDAPESALQFLVALVHASDRRSSGGTRRRLTVSVSWKPSKMLSGMPGASSSIHLAESRVRPSASGASLGSHASRSGWRTQAACTSESARRLCGEMAGCRTDVFITLCRL